MRKLTNMLLLGLALLLQAVAGQAQTPPDAGALRQQLERDLKQLPPPRTAPLEAAAATPLALPDGARLTVQAFRFQGHGLFSEAELAALLTDYLNRPIGFADLQQATQLVAQAYRAAGWVVSTMLPQQDVTDGVVTIRIVEAVYAGARIEGSPSTRVDPRRVLAHLDAAQQRGAPLNTRHLDRALLLADDLPGVSVSGALEPGAKEGETALVLRLADEPAASGSLDLDNAGARSTGALRITALGQLNSPLKRGDQLRAQAVLSAGSRYARLAYDLPVGVQGTRLGANASWLGYRLVGERFAALGGRGRSDSVGLELSHPLVRSRQHNLYLNAAWDQRRYVNEVDAGVQSDYANRGLTLGLNGNLYDDLGGGGASSAALALQHGRIDLGTPDAGEDPARGGSFTKLRLSLLRRQTLTPTLALVASLRGQYAGRVLDSSERFYLGGADGVRAYPASEGGGSQGALASLELRWQAAPAWALSAFADGGQVRDPGGSAATLKGVGAAVAWTAPQGATARLVLARRVGQNPNPTASGTDQDGSLVRHRAWLQVSLPF